MRSSPRATIAACVRWSSPVPAVHSAPVPTSPPRADASDPLYRMRNLSAVAQLLHDFRCRPSQRWMVSLSGRGGISRSGAIWWSPRPRPRSRRSLSGAGSPWIWVAPGFCRTCRAATGRTADDARRDDRRRRGAGARAGDVGGGRGRGRFFVDGLGARLVAGAPVALAQTKALLNEGADRTLRDALANEARAQGVNFATADVSEASRRSRRSANPLQRAMGGARRDAEAINSAAPGAPSVRRP